MSTWSDLAAEAHADAVALSGSGRVRAALNRCCYSLFSAISAAAAKVGYTMPAGWEGPRHDAVHEGHIVARHLRHLSAAERGKLIFIAGVLYKLRRDADYSPWALFSPIDARRALGRLLEARRILEAVR